MDKQFDGNWQQIVKNGALSFGVELSAGQLDLLTFHAKELIKWNKKFNITAIVDHFDVALKHFIDSVAIIPLIPDYSKVIDLGSGGGFPGIPLKVANPSLDIVMVDSSQKKVNFLKYLISHSWQIGSNSLDQDGIKQDSSNQEETGRTGRIKGINAIHCRAEELGKKLEYANQFDLVVSRAFTSLSKFTDMALPFLKKNGVILAMKGELNPDELDPIINRKDLKVDASEYLLPFEHHRRSVIIIRCNT